MTVTMPGTRTGICVVRAERQCDTLLITVTMSTDIEKRTSSRLSRHARDIPTTLDLVADFLREVVSPSPHD